MERSRFLRIAFWAMFLCSTLLVWPNRVYASQQADTVPSTESSEGFEFDRLDFPYEGNGSVEGISVGKSGWFLIVYEDSSQHHINVYDNLGAFQCRYVIASKYCSYGYLVADFDAYNRVFAFPVRRDTRYVLEKGNTPTDSQPFSPDYDWTNDRSASCSFRYETAGNQYIYKYGVKLIPLGLSYDFSVLDASGHELFHYQNSFDDKAKELLVTTVTLAILGSVYAVVRKKLNAK